MVLIVDELQSKMRKVTTSLGFSHLDRAVGTDCQAEAINYEFGRQMRDTQMRRQIGQPVFEESQVVDHWQFSMFLRT